MAEIPDRTREQKIRDVYEAMRKASQDTGCFIPEPSPAVSAMARAAVNMLDPVKRIALSPGFHAEPPTEEGETHTVYREYPGCVPKRVRVGGMTKDAVEAWAEAAISHQKLNWRPEA